MMAVFGAEFLLRALSIVAIDLAVAGDNALVIALAVRSLPPRQRAAGRVWGVLGAIVLRLVLILGVTWLFLVPFVRLVGGLVLLWVAARLVCQRRDHMGAGRPATTLLGAIGLIMAADVVMSLDNVLAVAAAAHGDFLLALFGVALSLPIVVWGSGLVAHVMSRHASIVWIGGGILGYVAGEMIVAEPAAGAWIREGSVIKILVPISLAVFIATLGWWSGSTRRHRRRVGRLAIAMLVALLLGAVAAVGYFYSQDQARLRAEAERAVAEAERQRRQREFVAAFVSAAPRPKWWDTVTTPHRMENVGDLLSAWEGHPRTAEGERQFFKSAYQGIVERPDDAEMVATAIDLLYSVVRDYPHRLALARFGFERYFLHRARTDNCWNCMPGDTTQRLAHNLAQLYAAVGRYDEAIAVCRKLVDERSGDVSPHKLAETWDQIAWLYWRKGERG